MPTTSLPRTTGKRLMRRFSIVRTTSSSGVSSVTVNGSAVMMSWILRPWERVYSSASRPGPIKNSSQLGRRRCVPVSARRRKSPSVTIPTRLPFWSITGRPLMCRCSIIRTACHIDASGSTDITETSSRPWLSWRASISVSRNLTRPSRRYLIYIKPAAAKEPEFRHRSRVSWARGAAVTPPAYQGRAHRVIMPIRLLGGATSGPIDCDGTGRIAALSSVLCRLSEGTHHILARDHANQLALGADNGKAASLQARHQLESSSQRRRRFDVHDGFGHHFRHRAFHQFIVVRHHLTGGEGECSEKIEFGHDALAKHGRDRRPARNSNQVGVEAPGEIGGNADAAVQLALYVDVDRQRRIGHGSRSRHRTHMGFEFPIVRGPAQALRSSRMRFDVALQPTDLILELSARPLECIVESKMNVRMPLVQTWRTPDIDLLSVRER